MGACICSEFITNMAEQITSRPEIQNVDLVDRMTDILQRLVDLEVSDVDRDGREARFINGCASVVHGLAAGLYSYNSGTNLLNLYSPAEVESQLYVIEELIGLSPYKHS